MQRRTLKNKPLVEAIFELRWDLEERASGIAADPHYALLIGRLYDRIQDDYPFHEELPAADIPDEMAPYLVQHRFRRKHDDWPLVQLGPGILTVNETEAYEWESFSKRTGSAVASLFSCHPGAPNGPAVRSATLRYIDAVEFDFGAADPLGRIGRLLKVHVGVHQPLFTDTGVGAHPLRLDLQAAFPCERPKGEVALRCARGRRLGKDALVWETAVQSSASDAPQSAEAVRDWVEQAHELTDDWFFKMIEGELERRFQ